MIDCLEPEGLLALEDRPDQEGNRKDSMTNSPLFYKPHKNTNFCLFKHLYCNYYNKLPYLFKDGSCPLRPLPWPHRTLQTCSWDLS